VGHAGVFPWYVSALCLICLLFCLTQYRQPAEAGRWPAAIIKPIAPGDSA
jgi:hypothetical protein